MAIAAEELTPEVAGEYQRLVGAGGAPGKTSLDHAKTNVRQASGPTTPPLASSRPTRSARPRYAMEQSTGSLWVGQHARQAVRIAPRLLPSSVSGRSSILSRLITALFVGLLALEVASYVTGRYFGYSLRTPLKPRGDQTYRPLYKGQELNPASPAPALPDAGVPGAFASLPLGHRSAGNQQVGP